MGYVLRTTYLCFKVSISPISVDQDIVRHVLCIIQAGKVNKPMSIHMVLKRILLGSWFVT